MSSAHPLSRRAQQMPASPIRRLAPFAVAGPQGREDRPPAQHRPARHPHAPGHPRPPALLRRGLCPLRAVAGAAGVHRGAALVLRRDRRDARRRGDLRHHRRQRGAPVHARRAVRRRRPGDRLRALLHQLQRLRRDDGRRARARDHARRGRLPLAVARSDRDEDRAAHARRPHLLAQQPDRHGLHATPRSTCSPPSAASAAWCWSPTRSTASSSTRGAGTARC